MTGVRLCLFGDSHASAMRQGWRKLAGSFPGVAVDVFPCPGTMISDTVCDGRAIVATGVLGETWQKWSKTDRFDLDRYDAFILIGFGTFAYRHASLLRRHALVNGNRARLANRPVRPLHLVSESALAATVTDRLRSEDGFDRARRIRDAAARPMFFIPTPRPSAEWLAVNGSDWLRREILRRELAILFDCVDRATAEVVHEFGGRLLAQPPETLDGPFTTRAEYLRVNDPDAGPGRSRDLVHMNEQYGVDVWRAHLPTILSDISAAPSAAALGRAAPSAAE
jgi:hypothetical protein